MEIKEIYKIYLEHPDVTTDSRNCPKGSIFVALKGDNFNGNLFASQAIQNGSAYAFVDEVEYADGKQILLVENCLEMMQQLAKYHRNQLRIPVIGITGTNGKTTTKELVSTVLSKKYNVLFTQGNLNNHIGVPLTLLKLNNGHQIAVIEMGANHPGEIKELAEIAEPDWGIITNVGKAHLEGFGSFEGVIRTKSELYDYLRTKEGGIFIDNDNEYLLPLSKGIKKITYGESDSLYVSGKVIGNDPFLSFQWVSNGIKSVVKTNLIGGYNLKNCLVAAAVGVKFGVLPNDVSKAISEYVPSNNRSQLTKTERNTLIVDAYNANPSSMSVAISNFGSMVAESKILILGDMFELGDNSLEEHQKIVDLIDRYVFDKVILCGANFCKTENRFITFADTTELIRFLKLQHVDSSTVLIKGSRGMKLESLIKWL